MAVQFILGSAGAGKSHKLYTILTDRASKNEDTDYVAIVPEQYSMESQKEIIKVHPRHGAFNTEVVSFNRLAMGIFQDMGADDKNIMDDLGKTLVLRKVLEDCRNNLKLYSKKIAMPGFVDKIKSTISELQQYDIGLEELKKMIENANERTSLKYKLQDIYTIYEGFNKYLGEKTITQEEVLNILCRFIPTSEKIANSEYFIDGFTGFTPIQKNVVTLLTKYAKNVTFAFTLPQEEVGFRKVSKQELFALSKKTVLELKWFCMDNGINILDDIVVENRDVNGEKRPYRMQNSGEISYIENNIFRYKKSEIYKKECNDVSLHKVANPRKEAEYIAFEIASLMRKSEGKNKLRYRDIAVITADMETYYRYLEEAFEEYNIPAFIDHKRNISDNPFVVVFNTVMEIIEKDFSYESVFCYFRLGIGNWDQDLVDRMENYVLASGRRGFRSYSSKWEKTYGLFTEEELENINNLKDDFMEQVKPLRECLKNKETTVKERVTALYNFAVNMNMQNKIAYMEQQLRESEELSKASEYRQTYAAIIDLFDKVVDMLGDEIMTLKEFKGIMESGFESIKVGIIPPAADGVMVGDIERTRLKDIKKIVFLAGANDGIIPKNTSGAGIISDMEREFLEKASYELAPTARENAFTQRLYLYVALTKPSRKLYITFSKSNSKGEEIRKSYIVSVLEKMFEKIKVIDEDEKEDGRTEILSPRDAYRYFAKALAEYRHGKSDNRFYQTYSFFYDNEKYRDMLLSMVDATFYKSGMEKLDEKTATMLYGLKDNIGITRLERFAACAYSQFVQNGLKLKQRRHYELAAYDLGNLYHSSIDLFCREIKERNIKWSDIDDHTRKEIVNMCVNQVVEEYDNDVLSSTARNIYIAKRVAEITDKTVKVLGKHLARGRFEPEQYEYVVNHGRIDRVDVFRVDDRIYMKVIDYKSGKKTFKMEDTFYGLQLQLVVYLNDAIERMEKENPDKTVLPGGAFYYHIQNPYIAKPDYRAAIEKYRKMSQYADMSDKELEEIISEDVQFEEFKLSGLVNENQEVLDAMDMEAKENKKSDIIKLKYTNNGIDKRTSQGVIKSGDFKAVLDYAMYKTDKMKNEIMSGNIDVNPYGESCSYCPYQGICKFDTALGDKYREKQKFKANELMEKIRNKEDDADNNQDNEKDENPVEGDSYGRGMDK